ncbi:MAG: hypothetical protein WBR15_03915 [Gammaproteobacteria bacterium]
MRRGSLQLAAALLASGAGILCAAALAQSLAPTAGAAARTEQAGSAVLAVGTVTDTAADGSTRQLQDGDFIYSGDRITTGDDSYADLDFEDGGRMLLRPDTDFQIQQYHYDPAAHAYALAPSTEPGSYAQTQPTASAEPSAPVAPAAQSASAVSAPAQQEHESAFFRLIKGGFRAISGFIGHVDHQDYAVETPVATIGIRGTGYEVRYCESGCAEGEQGLYTGVGTGAIALKNQAGESVTTAGRFGYVQNSHALFRHLAYAPRALQHMQLPPRYRARDARNFRRVQLRRQQRWKTTPQYRHRAGNIQHYTGRGQQYRYGALQRSRAVQQTRHAQQQPLPQNRKNQARKKKREHPPYRLYHDGGW